MVPAKVPGLLPGGFDWLILGHMPFLSQSCDQQYGVLPLPEQARMTTPEARLSSFNLTWLENQGKVVLQMNIRILSSQDARIGRTTDVPHPEKMI